MRLGCLLVVSLLWASASNLSAQLAEWVVEPAPILSVGTDPGQELGFVLDAARTRDGGLLVADRATQSLMRFSADGAFMGETGREGQGPLEFLNILAVYVEAGATFVVDPGNFRISVLDRDRLAREIRIATPFVPGEALRFADGRWLIRRSDRFGPDRLGFKRDTIDYVVMGEAMDDPIRIATVPGVIGLRWQADRGTFIRTAPFTPEPKAATWGNCRTSSPSSTEARSASSILSSEIWESWSSRSASD